MEIITAQQAAEAAKGLTFETVWAALMESRIQMQEFQQELAKENAKSQKENQESLQAMKRTVEELSRNVGGVNNSFGRFMESLFSGGLADKFNELGYEFNRQGPHVKFFDKPSGKILAEADYFLEDGQYAMVVEVKINPKESDVDDHLERIAVIRKHLDNRADKRIIVGAIAGGIVHDNVLKYALKQGLYVLTQAGDSAVVAELPEGFKAREW